MMNVVSNQRPRLHHLPKEEPDISECCWAELMEVVHH